MHFKLVLCGGHSDGAARCTLPTRKKEGTECQAEAQETVRVLREGLKGSQVLLTLKAPLFAREKK